MPFVQIFRISGDTLNSTTVKHIFVTTTRKWDEVFYQIAKLRQQRPLLMT